MLYTYYRILEMLWILLFGHDIVELVHRSLFVCHHISFQYSIGYSPHIVNPLIVGDSLEGFSTGFHLVHYGVIVKGQNILVVGIDQSHIGPLFALVHAKGLFDLDGCFW